MKTKHLTAADVRAKLAPLNLAQTQALSDASSVPFTTLLKIKRGETENPGINTVAAFLPLIKGVMKQSKVAA